eukprot:snap_masked-scaffold_6-processed-gene-8.39-mRNA-1 protein AED:1.00 eAED:1.00 QI:0/0/0/0/1/1/2/0/198
MNKTIEVIVSTGASIIYPLLLSSRLSKSKLSGIKKLKLEIDKITTYTALGFDTITKSEVLYNLTCLEVKFVTIADVSSLVPLHYLDRIYRNKKLQIFNVACRNMGKLYKTTLREIFYVIYFASRCIDRLSFDYNPLDLSSRSLNSEETYLRKLSPSDKESLNIYFWKKTIRMKIFLIALILNTMLNDALIGKEERYIK